MATRIIAINWTSVTDVAVTGYNIYIVNGAPPTTTPITTLPGTKTFLAFVSNKTSSQYIYNGIEGTQYEFEVRSTDGTNESPPMQVFYPNGTSLYTPTLITPDGKPMQISRDSQYMTSLEYMNWPNGLKLTTASPLYTSGILDMILQMASEEVNRYCNRHFDAQTIDEVYDGVRISSDYPKMIYIPLNESPIQNVISINLQVLQFFINFSLQYLQVFPDKGYIQIVPFLGGSTAGTPLPAAVMSEGIFAKIWVRYTAGYDVPPVSIKAATALFANRYIGLQENPVGAKSVRFGRNFQLEWDSEHDPVYLRIQQLLNPYINYVFRRP